MNTKYWIKMTSKQSASEGYAFTKFAFRKAHAQEIIKAMRILHPDQAWTMVPEGSLSGMCEPQQKDDLPPIALFTDVELHLSPHDETWTRKFGKRVKEAGGSYSACRGYADCRFVHLPIMQWELINDIMRHEIDRAVEIGLKGDRKTCMIARNFHVPGFKRVADCEAGITVHYWTRSLQERGDGLNATRFLVSIVWKAVASALASSYFQPDEPAPAKVNMLANEPLMPSSRTNALTDIMTKLDAVIGLLGDKKLDLTQIGDRTLWMEVNAARHIAHLAVNLPA